MIHSLGARHPKIHERAWVAPTATVIGSVDLEEEATMWFSSVARGDNDRIRVGARSNVQDGAVLHTDAGIVLDIGSNVTIGHQAMLHGCTIEDDTLIGIGAIVLNRARIGRHSIIGAGALIAEGKVIPPRSLVMGVPGKIIRQVTDEEIALIGFSAAHYVEKIAMYKEL